VKVAPREDIQQLVNLALPGIPLNPMPAAPRQLPFHAGATYFQLETGVELWGKLQNSSAIAFHVAGKFPGLKMTFWAIKGG
jgi:type VI secretion system protein ImpJ